MAHKGKINRVAARFRIAYLSSDLVSLNSLPQKAEHKEFHVGNQCLCEDKTSYGG